MHINFHYRWLLLQIVLINTCFVVTFARGGGGRGSSSGGGRGSSSGGGRGSSSSGSRVGTSSGGARISGGSSNYGSKPSQSKPSISHSSPSSSLSRPSPSHSWPSPSYSWPSPSYSWPSPSHSWPSPSHSWPSPSHSWASPSHSRPSPSHSWPSPSHSWPSPSYERPSFYARPHHHQPSYHAGPHRPSYSFTSGSDYEDDDGSRWYDRDRPKNPGKCEPFSSLDLPCPPDYEGYKNYKSISDLEESNKYERATPWTFSVSERNKPEEDEDCEPYPSINMPCPPEYRKAMYFHKTYGAGYRKTPSIRVFPKSERESGELFQSRNKPTPGSNRQTEIDSGNCSPYSELKLPCPPDYESSASDVAVSEKNSKDSLSKTDVSPKADKKEIPSKPSISRTKSKEKAKNSQKFHMVSRNKTCIDIPYPEHSLGGYTWQPYCGIPAPTYMNYIGIPTGRNMNGKPFKRKGLIGSLMSAGTNELIQQKQTNYHGTFPSPYGIKHLKNYDTGYVNEHFLGEYSSSASLYTILPFMSQKNTQKIHKINFPSVLMYMPSRRFQEHHYLFYLKHTQFMNLEHAEYTNIFDDNYVGMCLPPLKGQHTKVECENTLEEIKCNATCSNGYNFPQNTELLKNHCWHVTGVWRPQKNFPDCKPVCGGGCQNGGECIRPSECRCAREFRGNLCQFHPLCNMRLLVANDRRISWVCHHSKNETVCKVRCKEPADFEYPAAVEYKCTPDGLWTPDTVPRCIL